MPAEWPVPDPFSAAPIACFRSLHRASQPISNPARQPSSFLKTTLAAIVLGLGALSAGVPAASAASLTVEVDTVGYRNGYYGQHHHRRWARDPGYRGRCAGWLAVDKARAHGIRHARIAEVTPRRVVVDGRRHHRYVRIAFANAPRCPVLWR